MSKRVLNFAPIKSSRQNQIHKPIKGGKRIPEKATIALASKNPKEYAYNFQPNHVFSNTKNDPPKEKRENQKCYQDMLETDQKLLQQYARNEKRIDNAQINKLETQNGVDMHQEGERYM